jgi:hypothetical protein
MIKKIIQVYKLRGIKGLIEKVINKLYLEELLKKDEAPWKVW